MTDRVLLIASPGSGNKALTAEELTTYDQALRDALTKQPDQARLLMARSLVLRWQRKTKEALPLIKRAATLDPRNAAAHYHLGTCIFESIDSDAGLGALSAVDEAKAALDKVIELEPDHIWARYALAQFYIQAPGIAGGSYRKARELAKQVLAMPEGKGQFMGHLMLGQVAEHDEDWKVMISEYELAEKATGEGASPVWALSSLATALVRKKTDLARAKPVIERYAAVAPPDSATLAFLTGEVARMEKRWADAAVAYERVLQFNPDALNSSYALALCCEELGERTKAATLFARFAEKFPEDERATTAKKKAIKLAK